jgi:hypothetical protein
LHQGEQNRTDDDQQRDGLQQAANDITSHGRRMKAGAQQAKFDDAEGQSAAPLLFWKVFLFS